MNIMTTNKQSSFSPPPPRETQLKKSIFLTLTFFFLLIFCKDADADSGGLPITSIAAFKTWLDAQSANTAAAPYNVKLNISDLGGQYNTVGSLGNALYTNLTKYVNLDLSGSTFTTMPSVSTNGSFRDCSNLTGVTIPNSVTTIGQQAFLSCTSLTSVTIPNSVTSIGISAFASCTSLPAINVDTANSAYTSDNGILYNKEKTLLHTYPAGKAGVSFTIPAGVTSIENNAFRDCTSLASVTIPADVTSILYYAFSFCTSLTSVTFAVGSSIPDGDFGNNAFPEGSRNGNALKTAYSTGKEGTYTREAGGSTWTKQ